MSGALLVLGAGEEQVALYREARKRSLPTIAVDMRADRPGIALADEFLRISTTDHAAIADALAGREIAGVVSTAADTCLRSWCELSRHFGTPWQFADAAATVSMDKAAFHRIATAAGIPTYRWVQSADLTELSDVVSGFRFPVVVKPTDASGGRGVQGVAVPAALAAALESSMASSPRGAVIVEEQVIGIDYTVNVFMIGGEVAHSIITEKQIIPGPSFLIGGHLAPARLTDATAAALIADARRLCLAFDLTDGPANFDVIVSDDGTCYFLEVGARMSGNGFPQLAHTVSGVDVVAALLDLATGQPVDLTTRWHRAAQLHVLISPLSEPGELVAAEGLDRVRALPQVQAVDLFVHPGDRVLPFTEAGRKLGWVVVGADTHDELPVLLAEAVTALDIMVQPDEREPVTT